MIPLYALLPYCYFLKTRLSRIFQKLSWVFVYFVPTFYLFFQFADVTSFIDWGLLITGLLLINYVYENGYLENDVITVKNEKEPTLRLSQEQADIINKKFGLILTSRYLILFILTGLYYFLAAKSNTILHPFFFITALLLIQLLYIFYNRIRNIVNLFLILPLSFLRFFGFIFPFVPREEMTGFIFLTLLIYPLSKFMEFMKRKRFALKVGKFIGNVDTFRIRYYTFILLTTLVLKFTVFNNIKYYYIYIIAYFLIYRLISVMALKVRKISIEFNDNFGRK